MGEVHSSETSVDSTGLHNITPQKIFTIVRTSYPEYRFNMEIERNSTQKEYKYMLLKINIMGPWAEGGSESAIVPKNGIDSCSIKKEKITEMLST